MALIYFVFPKVRTPKTQSYKCLESPISDDPSTSNMVNVENHCTNLHHSTFIIFNDHSQVNWVGKSLSYWHAKSWCCLLTHWLPMKSIQFLIETIWRYQFRCNDLRKTKTFSNFFPTFLKCRPNFKHFKKKLTLIAFVFPNLRTPKTRLYKYIKGPVSEDLSTSNMAHVPKHCWNLHHRIFMIFLDPCQVNWLARGLFYWHAKSWDCLLTHWLSMKSILLLIETN